jgi:heptosyltransferase-2
MKSILIIKLAAIGDVLRTTSILQGLREKYNAEIYWVTKKESYDILKNNHLIKEVICDNTERLRNEKFDLVINLDEDYEVCKLATMLNSKIIGAYLKDGKVTYTDDSAQWFDLGLISRYGKEKADELKKINKKTYQQYLCEILKINPGKLILNLEEKEIEFADKFAERNSIKKEDLVIGLNTSAGKRWKLKSLSIEKTIEIANRLVDELKAKVILFGGKEEKERNEEIKKSAKVIDGGCDNNLLEFASLINLCNIVVCSDSLAMHIAVALNKKVVVFFGPTSHAEIELYGLGKKIIPDIGCICCYKKNCNKKPNCMDLIKVDDIVGAVKKLI